MTPARPRAEPTVWLVRGDDPSLVAQAAHRLVQRLSEGSDPALVVEEHGGVGADELDVGAVIDACTTPPFFGDRRVVVVRDAGRLNAAAAGRLVGYLEDPVPTTRLVLVGGGGTVPAPLVKAISGRKGILDASPGTGRDRRAWMAEQVRGGPVDLSAGALARLTGHLGDDLGRLSGLLETLAAAYGEGASVGEAELEPFLGEAGGVPPWELTDAVDEGATAPALGALRRMLGPGGRGAPEVIGILARHYANMLRLDGAGADSAEAAAHLLGVRHPFAAKKALGQAQRLGSEAIGRAVLLVADADLDVKGQTALPSELVMEVLVARLSRLVRRRVPAAR